MRVVSFATIATLNESQFFFNLTKANQMSYIIYSSIVQSKPKLTLRFRGYSTSFELCFQNEPFPFILNNRFLDSLNNDAVMDKVRFGSKK